MGGGGIKWEKSQLFSISLRLALLSLDTSTHTQTHTESERKRQEKNTSFFVAFPLSHTSVPYFDLAFALLYYIFRLAIIYIISFVYLAVLFCFIHSRFSSCLFMSFRSRHSIFAVVYVVLYALLFSFNFSSTSSPLLCCKLIMITQSL